MTIEVRGSWGDHVMGLRRGPSYPLTLADIEALRHSAGDPVRWVAVAAVTDSGPIRLRLEDKDGRGLAASRIDLRSLVESKDRAVMARRPGRPDAARIRLTLSAGEEFQ